MRMKGFPTSRTSLVWAQWPKSRVQNSHPGGEVRGSLFCQKGSSGSVGDPGAWSDSSNTSVGSLLINASLGFARAGHRVRLAGW